MPESLTYFYIYNVPSTTDVRLHQKYCNEIQIEEYSDVNSDSILLIQNTRKYKQIAQYNII